MKIQTALPPAPWTFAQTSSTGTIFPRHSSICTIHSWLQRMGNTAREGVQNMHHWSEPKQQLRMEWAKLDHVILAAIHQWHRQWILISVQYSSHA